MNDTKYIFDQTGNGMGAFYADEEIVPNALFRLHYN
jgi:hypothetical protein